MSGLAPDLVKDVNRLVSSLDMVASIHLKRLGSPFDLNEQGLAHWVGNLRHLRGELTSACEIADGCMIEPDTVVGELRDIDEALRVPCEAAAIGGGADDELRADYVAFVDWLRSYVSYGVKTLRYWLVNEPERFGKVVHEPQAEAQGTEEDFHVGELP